MLAKIYRGSATFREQCDRIAAARTLSVTLQLDTNIPRSCMAFTRFQRKGGIYETSFEVYESTRAQRVGRSVAVEVATGQTGD